MSDPLTDAIRQSTEFEAYKEERLLRDQIAMAALQGILSHEGWSQDIEKHTYIIADAMLEARKEKK